MVSDDQEDLPRPSRLWRDLPAERRVAAAEAFWQDDEAVEQQAEALGLLARQLRFRPQSVRGLSPDRKARYLARVRMLPDTVALRALVSYHLAHERPMMAAFLDALGLAHTDGVIGDDEVKPDSKKLAKAARALAAKFPGEAVALYFAVLVAQDADAWGGLSGLKEARPAGD